MSKCVFLDRDGVINRAIIRNGKPYPPTDLDDLEILPGVKEALRKLREAGWYLIVVTNQPDVSRGKVSIESVEEINKYLLDVLDLDHVCSCYHDDHDNCKCRKPKPGLLLDAAKKFKANIRMSYMIGDRWRDIEAGQSAGCKTIFIDYNYDEKRPAGQTYNVSSLLEAANLILGNKNEKN